jgi:hypothetical protein
MSVSCARIGAGSDYETAVIGWVRRGDRSGAPAYIRLVTPDGEFASEVRCTPEGYFLLPIIPGRWKVVCLAPRGSRLEQALTIGRGDQYEVDFWLEAA